MDDWHLLFCHPDDLPAIREAMGPFGFSLLSAVERSGLSAGSVYVMGVVGDYASLPIAALRTAMEAARLTPPPCSLADAVRALASVLTAYRT
jgi:hypothetical protein